MLSADEFIPRERIKSEACLIHLEPNTNGSATCHEMEKTASRELGVENVKWPPLFYPNHRRKTAPKLQDVPWIRQSACSNDGRSGRRKDEGAREQDENKEQTSRQKLIHLATQATNHPITNDSLRLTPAAQHPRQMHAVPCIRRTPAATAHVHHSAKGKNSPTIAK
ncbi:hypothetical protein C8R48DRAFT_671297 [Suillus tomentosus]|nr:hypothetical protein C8R48DRAFT_671297 [Suillus tomentosus]